MTQQSDDTNSSNDPSPLHSAVQFADLIRKHSLAKKSTTASSDDKSTSSLSLLKDLPGLPEGLAAGLVTAAVLTPVRSQLLGRLTSQQHTHLLADMFVTSTQAILAATAALYVGSLSGSTVLLKQLARVPVDRPSAVADNVCSETQVKRWMQEYDDQTTMNTGPGLTSSAWDPRQSTLRAFYQALNHCRQRQELQRQQEVLSETEVSNQRQEQTRITWWR